MYGPQVYDFVQHMTVRNWIRRKRDIVMNAVMTLKIIQLCFSHMLTRRRVVN